MEADTETKAAPGKRRPQPASARIAARVASFGDAPSLVRKGIVGAKETVTLLNPGFFHLERMRQATVTKKKAKARKKAQGK